MHWKRKLSLDEDKAFFFLGIKQIVHAILYVYSEENTTQYHKHEHSNYAIMIGKNTPQKSDQIASENLKLFYVDNTS